MRIDKKTGFIDDAGFSAHQKGIVLDIYRKTANLTKAAKTAGVTRHLVVSTFEQDQAFYMAYRAVMEELCDDREETLYLNGRHNVTAAIIFLKNLRPQTWADKPLPALANGGDKLKGLLDELKKDNKLIDVKDKGKRA